MCSNYESNGSAKDLEGRFDLPCLPLMPNKQNIRPTDLALIIDANRTMRLLPWGIPQPWQDGKNAQPIINARAETIDQKPTFRPLLSRRCLVPATAWFEWREVGGNKLKNQINLKDEPLFAFAGLASDSHFTIITCEPVPSIAHIHSRMPVVLTPAAENAWLDVDSPFEAVAKHLAPYAGCPLGFNEEQPVQSDLFT
jgi:putative SOS response-associated peptidase YedK